MMTKAIEELFNGPASQLDQEDFRAQFAEGYVGNNRWGFGGMQEYKAQINPSVQQLTAPGALPVTPSLEAFGVGGRNVGYEAELVDRDFGNLKL